MLPTFSYFSFDLAFSKNSLKENLSISFGMQAFILSASHAKHAAPQSVYAAVYA